MATTARAGAAVAKVERSQGATGASDGRRAPKKKPEVEVTNRPAAKRPRAALSKVHSPAAGQGSVNTDMQRTLFGCQAHSSYDKGRFVSHTPPPPSTWETSEIPLPRRTTKLSNLELQAFKVGLLLEPRHISSASQDWKQPSTFNDLPFVFNKGLGVIFPANTLKSR